MAIKLLLNGDVKRIVINDLDPTIYCFWHSILDHTEDFCAQVHEVDITMEEWVKQREIYFRQDISKPLELGFATFYLNRTNISGVIKGGVIGGINQNGTNNISARFNKESLISKIQSISSHKDQIIVLNLDAQELLEPINLRRFYKALINFDPPYVKKAQNYTRTLLPKTITELCQRQ